MLQTTILFISMIVVFVGYVSYIWNKYGVLESISESYYRLPDNQKILFTLFCWLFAIPAIILGNTALMFVAGGGIAFVGAAAQFKQDMTKSVHYGGAIIGILFSQLSIFFDFHMLYVNIISLIITSILFIFHKKCINYFWWIELTAFASIVYTLFKCIF